MREKAIISILIVLSILIITNYELPLTGRFESVGEVEKSNLSGEILSADYSPDIPKLLERLTVIMVIKNNGREKNDYLVDLKLTKNGQLKYSDDFTFSLLPGNTFSLSPNYNPDDVGEHEIVIRLYDRDQSKLYDEKILKFTAQSDVGPFDLEVDMPSHVIGLGDSLPVAVIIKNMGSKESDIGLNLELGCNDGRKITNNMVVLAKNSSGVRKEILMSTCGELGQYTIISSLTFYDKLLMMSKNQFYVKENLPNILMNSKNLIKLNVGKSSDFSIELTNPNNFDLINVQPFIYGMPSDSLSIKPSHVNVLKPNETVMFTATINLPRNAETKNYELTIGVGGDNVFHTMEATASVIGIPAKSLVEDSSILKAVISYRTIIIFAFVIILSLLIISSLSSYSNRVYLKMKMENFKTAIKKLIFKTKTTY